MGRRKLVRIILEAGPDLTIANQQKETASDIAARKGHKEIEELLKNPPEVKQFSKNVNDDDIAGTVMGDGVDNDEDDAGPGQNRKNRRRSKDRGKRLKSGGKYPNWSPYGCHYYPDPSEFPDPNPSSLPEEPLGKGEQYFLDLAGNIKKGPISNGYTCYCAPVIDRFEKRMEKNKREIARHLDTTHGRLANRITHLERRTKDQLSNMSNNMKENFAQVPHIRTSDGCRILCLIIPISRSALNARTAWSGAQSVTALPSTVKPPSET